MLDERSYLIIQKIMERPFIEKQNLQEQTKLTQRQIDYSLEKINSWLASHHKKPIEINSYNQISVDYETRELLINEVSNTIPVDEYVLSSEERIQYMFLYLFINIEYLSINHFIDALKVGKTTIMGDLKALAAKLQHRGISLGYNRKQGYHLVGTESEIRYLGLKLIVKELNTNNNTKLFGYFLRENHLESYEQMKQIVLFYSNKHKIHFIENRLTEFIYSFLFLKTRLKTKESVNFIHEWKSVKSTKEYQFAEELLSFYHLQKEDNICYLTAWVLGLTLGEADEYREDFPLIMDLVEHIRMRFESFSGIRFEHPREVSKQIFRHFRSAYYRLLFHLPIVNPLYEKIIEEYNHLFTIVNETMKPLSVLFKHPIPAEEVAYLTIHFASLSRNEKEGKVNKKVGVIVCPNGVGSSSITHTVLKSIFPEFTFLAPIETQQLDKIDVDYDLLFSTVPDIRLFYTKKPVFIVSPVMDIAEKYRLIRDVYTELGNSFFKLPNVELITQIVEKYAVVKEKEQMKRELYEYFAVNEKVELKKEQGPNLSEIISPNLIQLHVLAKNWQDAISLSALPLLQERRITENYIQKMIENARKDGPYMVIMPNVALPHARPADGVNQLSISIAVLNEPVYFDKHTNKPVQFVFCLAAINQEFHLNALSQLVQLLEKEEFYHILKTSNTSEEVFDYICYQEENNIKLVP
ncbi:BglG family transcription antiterminator [Bacillus sp. PK3-056]|uniref:BglG family transcription antiterminator n=1 Tax=Niallia circulans TaxID=1397 RepID=UPI000F45B4F7|nr:BglG family transcription antiterminator [Niallia circulans]AYV71521.1 transcription antiterminator [Niallia circulans]